MTTTSEVVVFGSIEQEGICDHCGALWIASGTKQPGANVTERFDCPKCGKPAGSMHCAFGPSLRALRKRSAKKRQAP
jgi:hypothetical protein